MKEYHLLWRSKWQLHIIPLAGNRACTDLIDMWAKVLVTKVFDEAGDAGLVVEDRIGRRDIDLHLAS